MTRRMQGVLHGRARSVTLEHIAGPAADMTVGGGMARLPFPVAQASAGRGAGAARGGPAGAQVSGGGAAGGHRRLPRLLHRQRRHRRWDESVVPNCRPQLEFESDTAVVLGPFRAFQPKQTSRRMIDSKIRVKPRLTCK